MLRSETQILPNAMPVSMLVSRDRNDVVDTFITADPTPKRISRRDWRRRRVARGKS